MIPGIISTLLDEMVFVRSSISLAQPNDQRKVSKRNSERIYSYRHPTLDTAMIASKFNALCRGISGASVHPLVSSCVQKLVNYTIHEEIYGTLNWSSSDGVHEIATCIWYCQVQNKRACSRRYSSQRLICNSMSSTMLDGRFF